MLYHQKDLITPSPTRIILSYKMFQPAYDDISKMNPNVELIEGLNLESIQFDKNVPTMLIVDDQMSDVVKNELLQTFAIRGVHHLSVSLILLNQNLFPQGKYGRDIRLNCHYVVIMKSPTLSSQVSYFGRQLFPDTPRFLSDAYKKATAAPYSSLVINLHPLCDDKLRISEGFFSKDHFVFVPK
jgi:hypothetical protein